MSDDIRPRGTVEVMCAAPGCGWCHWVDALDPALPDGPFWCDEHNPVPQPLITRKAPEPTAWRGEVCKCCGRRNALGFTVDNEDWQRVVGDEGTVLCLNCFDEAAEAMGVRYVLRETCAVAWWHWLDEVGS